MPEIGVFDYGSYSGQDTNSEDRESYKHQGVMDYMTQEQGFDNSRRSTIETHGDDTREQDRDGVQKLHLWNHPCPY